MAITYIDQPSGNSGGVEYLDEPQQHPALKSAGFMDAVKRIPGMAQKLAPMIPGIEPLTTAAEVYPTAEHIKNDVLPKAGEDVAGYLGEKIPNHPNVGAAMGTIVSKAPEIVSAGMGLGEIALGDSAVAQAIRKTPQMIGKEMEVGSKAAGISDKLPVQRGAFARFPNNLSKGMVPEAAQESLPMAPASYPKDPNAFVNFAMARVSAFGKKLSPQELNDTKTVLSTMMRDGKLAPGTPPYAIASKVKTMVTELHRDAIPGREELNKIYAISKTLHPELGKWLGDGAKKYGVKAIGAVLAGLGIGAGAKMVGH